MAGVHRPPRLETRVGAVYVLPYREDGHKRRILEVIKEHNEADWYEVEVGETLYQLVDVPLNGAEHGNTCAEPYLGCIICGHGGGRSVTFRWFCEHNIEAFGYGSQPFDLTYKNEWSDINRGWEKVFDEEKALKECASVWLGMSKAFGKAVKVEGSCEASAAAEACWRLAGDYKGLCKAVGVKDSGEAGGQAGAAAEAASLVQEVYYEVFHPWATVRAVALEDKAEKIIESMMKGTPAKADDDSDY